MPRHRSLPSAALALVLWLTVAATILTAGAGTALAAKKAHQNAQLGFRIKIEDTYVQVPPKPTSDEAYRVGEWYEDTAKYDAAQLRPTFQITWFATAKASAITGSGGAPDPAEDVPSLRFPGREGHTSLDQVFDERFEWYAPYYGPHVAAAERWKTAEKEKTNAGVPFTWFEVNPPTKKKPKDGEKVPPAYGFVAKLVLDRPGETVEVGFIASCEVNDAKKRFRSEFLQMVKSFEEIAGATDSRNEAAQRDLSDDPEKMIEQVIRTKVIPGWKHIVTKKRQYIVLYHKDVPEPEAKKIADQVEDLRAQLYETMFPPDRPIRAVSIVRVCKDRDQYMEYGAPGGSAGYWSSYHKELVFYYNKEDKKDPLRVLYHEAFHQYIHYSVGDFSPHSWFNEGHGDYFAGFNYSAGKFRRDEFDWRVDLAREWKRNPKRAPLDKWLTWTQAQYYGRNDFRMDGGANYALGWSFVYFLRTTKKADYQKILPTYFDTLKASVTRARLAREAWEKKLKERLGGNPPGGEPGGDPEGGSPGGDEPAPGDGPKDGPGATPDPGGGEKPADGAKPSGGEKPADGGADDDPFGGLPKELRDAGTPDQWLRDALKAALEGVDVAKLEKDWLAAD